MAVQLLNLPPGTVRSFVLDNDPVPRAMLSVDPTFAMLKQSAPMSWVLEARRAFLGSGVSFTPEKFLYENVGDVRPRPPALMPFHNHCSSLCTPQGNFQTKRAGSMSPAGMVKWSSGLGFQYLLAAECCGTH